MRTMVRSTAIIALMGTISASRVLHNSGSSTAVTGVSGSALRATNNKAATNGLVEISTKSATKAVNIKPHKKRSRRRRLLRRLLHGDSDSSGSSGSSGSESTDEECDRKYYVTTVQRGNKTVKTCVECSPGSTNAPGDLVSNGESACDVTQCDADHFVSDNVCTPCADGSTRNAGDLATGQDTECAATACDANHFVSDNVCTPCADGSTRNAGDLATGQDTVCESENKVNSNNNDSDQERSIRPAPGPPEADDLGDEEDEDFTSPGLVTDTLTPVSFPVPDVPAVVEEEETFVAPDAPAEAPTPATPPAGPVLEEYASGTDGGAIAMAAVGMCGLMYASYLYAKKHDQTKEIVGIDEAQRVPAETV